MTEPEPNLSRTNRNKKRKWSDNLLNILIAIVVVLIIMFSAIIFRGGEDNDKVTEKEPLSNEETAANESDEKVDENALDENLEASNSVEENADEKVENSDEEVDAEKSGVVTYASSDDNFVAETIINTAWEPIGTKQTGDHVSRYDGKSDDWNEKKEALAYATGLSVDSMIFKKIKNGGSPQESIGIVTSRDGAEKYRVYLQWVDGKGWKPVKMDVLTSLNFDY